MSDAAAGWYPDPSGQPGVIRYWDGRRWTEHSTPSGPPPGPPTRSGCATAAIISAIVAAAVVALIIVAAVVVAITGSKKPAALPVVHVAIGQTVTIPAGHRYVGEATITVYSLVVPYAVPAGDSLPDTVAALGDAQVCAGSSSANLSDPTVFVALPFEVILADGRQDQSDYNQFPVAHQLQDELRKLGPHQCIRGSLEFVVDAPSTVVAVGYSGTQALNVEWMLPTPVRVNPVTATTQP